MQSTYKVRILIGKGKGDVTTNLLSHRLAYPNATHSSLFKNNFKKRSLLIDNKVLKMMIVGYL